jgi:hypothetical protein
MIKKFISSFLCNHGFHDWEYQSGQYQIDLGNGCYGISTETYGKKCKRCQVFEYIHD